MNTTNTMPLRLAAGSTGVHAPTPDPAVVEAAVRQMQEVRA